MKKKITAVLLCTLFTTAFIEAKSDKFLFGHEDNLNILVNNRILAKVNGKAISVVDVMKKMDILFYRQFPEYTSSTAARFQFYQVNWKHMTSDLIDKELILADAAENKIPLTNGDIRQEMETLFGPNIIMNLDKIGMSYDEAWNIVKGDIVLRRTIYFKVNMKAMREVTPQAIRLEYNEFAKNNSRPESFVYQVISVRDSNKTRGQETADRLKQKLIAKELVLPKLVEQIKQDSSFNPETSISITDEFHHNEKEMSQAYRDVVLGLSEDTFSESIAQTSRADQSTVFRIFYLKQKIAGGALPFDEVVTEIKAKLQDQAMEKEMAAYLKKLHNHFDVQQSHLIELADEEYQPFTMK